MAISSDRVKPAKPHDDFPLFPHTSGQWAKKVRGNMRYFGAWEDPDAALNKWLKQKDELLAGREPREDSEGYIVRDAVNDFLDAKKKKWEAGGMTAQSFAEYFGTCKTMVAHFGNRVVSTLHPTDFAELHEKLSKRFGPVGLGNEVQRVRSVFKFAADNVLIDRPVVFGTVFVKPKRKEVRRDRRGKPTRFLQPAEIRALLAAANPAMKAMILLGVNAGMGNTDVSELRTGDVDLDAGILCNTRFKTEVARRSPLWPETVDAIRKAITTRPKHAREEDADRVFITIYGNPWRMTTCGEVEEESGKLPFSKNDSVGLEFGKLLRRVKLGKGEDVVSLKKDGVNFYALRHVFRTVGAAIGDIEAVDRIMGHAPRSVGDEHYDAKLGDKGEDARLRRVTNHVRKWLFVAKKGKAKAKAG